MWIFTRYGFFSIACANKPQSNEIDVDTVMVRARDKRQLLNLQERFKKIGIAEFAVECSDYADYRYRLIMPKDLWVQALSEMAKEQTWRNFKNEASLFEQAHNLSRRYVDALHEIWNIMHRLQVREGEAAHHKER